MESYSNEPYQALETIENIQLGTKMSLTSVLVGTDSVLVISVGPSVVGVVGGNIEHRAGADGGACASPGHSHLCVQKSKCKQLAQYCFTATVHPDTHW